MENSSQPGGQDSPEGSQGEGSEGLWGRTPPLHIKFSLHIMRSTTQTAVNILSGYNPDDNQGYLLGSREGVMKDIIELHYGNCVAQSLELDQN